MQIPIPTSLCSISQASWRNLRPLCQSFQKPTTLTTSQQEQATTPVCTIWRMNELKLTQAAIMQIMYLPRVCLLGISGRHRGWVGRFQHKVWHWLQLWFVRTWEGVRERERQPVWPSGRSRDRVTIYNHPHSIIYWKISSRRPISLQSKSLELNEEQEDTAALRMTCGAAVSCVSFFQTWLRNSVPDHACLSGCW